MRELSAKATGIPAPTAKATEGINVVVQPHRPLPITTVPMLAALEDAFGLPFVAFSTEYIETVIRIDDVAIRKKIAYAGRFVMMAFPPCTYERYRNPK